MKLKIYSLSATQANQLEGYILPRVRSLPDKDNFWYFAATEENYGFLGMTVIAPYTPEAELLSISVSPAYTHLGIASELISYTLEKLKEADIPVLRMTYALPPLAWRPLDNLMKQNGFLMDDTEKYTYKVTLEQLSAHTLISKKLNTNGVHTLSELSESEIHKLRILLSEKILFDPVALEECDPEHSFLWKTNDDIQALFLLSPLQDGQLTNNYTWLNNNSSAKLIALFQQSIKKASQDYPADTEVLFTCMVDASDHLLHYFLPNVEPVSILRSYCHGSLLSVDTDKLRNIMTEDSQNVDISPEVVHNQIPNEDRITYWNDQQLKPIDDSDLFCATCKYRQTDAFLSCAKYRRKPGDVLYGAPCKFYEK